VIRYSAILPPVPWLTDMRKRTLVIEPIECSSLRLINGAPTCLTPTPSPRASRERRRLKHSTQSFGISAIAGTPYTVVVTDVAGSATGNVYVCLGHDRAGTRLAVAELRDSLVPSTALQWPGSFHEID